MGMVVARIIAGEMRCLRVCVHVVALELMYVVGRRAAGAWVAVGFIGGGGVVMCRSISEPVVRGLSGYDA